MEALLQLKPSEIYVDEKYAGKDVANTKKLQKHILSI